jgi:hypothetical protein
LSVEEWADYLQEAIWLNYLHLKQQADLLASLFGAKK